MKYCSNCHRMSRDDDFCSHCGSAVYGDNSESNIDCSSFKGHEHEHDRDYRRYNMPESTPRPAAAGTNPNQKGAAMGCITVFIILFIIMFIVPFISTFMELFE